MTFPLYMFHHTCTFTHQDFDPFLTNVYLHYRQHWFWLFNRFNNIWIELVYLLWCTYFVIL